MDPRYSFIPANYGELTPEERTKVKDEVLLKIQLIAAEALAKRQAAKLIGVTWIQLHRWETGENKPNQNSLVKLAEFYQVSTDAILGRSPQQRSRSVGGAMSKILRIPEVLALLNVSRNTLYNWERAGKFPKRVNLGERSVGWPEDEVLAWLAARPRGIAQGA